MQLALYVVHHRQFVRNQQQHVRRAQRVRLRAGQGPRLHVAHHFVAEIPRKTARELERAGRRRHAVALEVAAHVLEGVALHLFQADVGTARIAQQAPHRRAACLDALGAGQADEGIAPEALTAHHRLEQVTVGAAGELEVHRQGRIEIRARFRQYRDAGIALLRELLEFQLVHGTLSAAYCVWELLRGLEPARRRAARGARVISGASGASCARRRTRCGG